MTKKPTKTTASKITFHEHLVLNRYLLSLFYKKDWAEMKAQIDEKMEGLAEDGQTKFFHQLTGVLFLGEGTTLSENDLRRYDLNVIRHWQSITQQRNELKGHILQMKYFQYLSLIFTEIYLDYYFNQKPHLQTALNTMLEQYKTQMGKNAEDFSPYETDELNTVAFWNATGSGKTLLMHVNILQYLHYCNEKTDKIIVLTPREGLSNQHVKELEESGFSAKLFDKNSNSPRSGDLSFTDLSHITVEVIDINKLSDKSGEKTIAVSEFEGRNLVLVDEGHSGSSAEDGAWQKRREALVKGGFAFEYSATLGQAVSSKKNALREKLSLIHI